jgi:hypothetical protein
MIDTNVYNNNGFIDDGNNPSCGDIKILNSNIKLYTLPTDTRSQTLSFELLTGYNTYTKGDLITFSFTTGSIKWGYPGATATVKADGVLYNQLVINQSGDNPYATSSAAPFISGSDGVDTLIFNNSLSVFRDYDFIPSGSNYNNSLYANYKDIEYSFLPKSGDIVILYYGSDNSFIESIVAKTAVTINGCFAIQLVDRLPSSLNGISYDYLLINKWLILSKIDDETNTLLVFDKPLGSTSYGFVIPSNLHPDMLNNIDIITKEVKQKLLI